MPYYVALMIETEVGDWRALFPDLPGCEARGGSLEAAKVAAGNELSSFVRANSITVSGPRDLASIARDRVWMSRNDVDFSKAVVAMIPMAAEGCCSLSQRKGW